MNVTTLARRVAAYGLPGHQGPIGTPGGQPLDDDTWARLAGMADHQRMVGFLQAAVQDGVLPATDRQRADVGGRHVRWCTSMLYLERALIRITAALDDADIGYVVLKGAAAAHLNYPSPEVRSFGDNDLLLRRQQFGSALEVLGDLGYERQFAEARPGFDVRFGKGAPLAGKNGDELDTHTNLMFGTFGFLVDVDELFASAITFNLGGRALPALGPETRLLHACYHASLGDPKPRLSGVRDLAQLMAYGSHDTGRLLDLVQMWECLAVLARGIALCRRYLDVAVPPELAAAVDGYRPTQRERRAIESYVGANRRFAAKVAASVPFIHGIRNKAVFLSSVLAPSPEFVRSHRSQPGLAWLRRGGRALLGGHVQRGDGEPR